MSCTAGHLAHCNLPPDLMRRLNPVSANERPRSIARNLFGHVDHDETRRSLEREMRRIREDDRVKWNFDFHEERPLSGRYQWEAVRGASRVGNGARAPDSPAMIAVLQPRDDRDDHDHDHDEDDGCPPLTSVRGQRSRISAATLVLPTRELSLASAARRTTDDAARDEPVAASASTRTQRQTTMKEYWSDKKPDCGTKRPASTETPVTNKMAVPSEIPAKKSKKEPPL